jgi:hypothetical protein
MFVRVKPSGPNHYLQICENHREGPRIVQRVLCTLGRVDALTADGTTDALLWSLARFGQQVRLVEDYRAGRLEPGAVQRVGPDLIFGRLWEQVGLRRMLTDLLSGRHFEFPVERAVYLTVLHRLFEAGSDRRAERWRRDVRVPGTEAIELHHLYRAMRWLGESKDGVEEALFQGRRDLFTDLSLAFFDTTSLYFEGQGGESLGSMATPKTIAPTCGRWSSAPCSRAKVVRSAANCGQGIRAMPRPSCRWWTGYGSGSPCGGSAGWPIAG